MLLASELHDIIAIIEACDNLTEISVSVEVTDSNGDVVGTIHSGDGDYAFYSKGE